MQRKNPHQHKHNWEMRFTERKWSTNVPESLKPYTDWGFDMRRYFACIRGGRIKHTQRAPDYYSYTAKRIMEEHVFLAASGFRYVDTKAEYVENA